MGFFVFGAGGRAGRAGHPTMTALIFPPPPPSPNNDSTYINSIVILCVPAS